MIDTNVKGLLCVTRIVARKMRSAGSGHIVNLGSIAGTEPYENGAVYCASKHAVHAISQAMRADLLAAGIKVTEIRPGMVETEFSLVRFHGDRAKADSTYAGVTPLTGADIAGRSHEPCSCRPHERERHGADARTAGRRLLYTHRKSRS